MEATKATIGWLALLTAFVAGGASGYAARSGLEREPQRELGVGDAAALGELRATLTGLRTDVEELVRRQTLLASAQTSAREPQRAEPSGSDLDRLRELVTRLEAATTGGVGHRTDALVIPVGRPHTPPDDVDDEAARRELSRHFELMTYQQVLDELGRPDEIYLTKYGDTGAVMWSYLRDPAHGPRETGNPFYLYFSDGLVIAIDS